MMDMWGLVEASVASALQAMAEFYQPLEAEHLVDVYLDSWHIFFPLPPMAYFPAKVACRQRVDWLKSTCMAKKKNTFPSDFDLTS